MTTMGGIEMLYTPLLNILTLRRTREQMGMGGVWLDGLAGAERQTGEALAGSGLALRAHRAPLFAVVGTPSQPSPADVIYSRGHVHPPLRTGPHA